MEKTEDKLQKQHQNYRRNINHAANWRNYFADRSQNIIKKFIQLKIQIITLQVWNPAHDNPKQKNYLKNIKNVLKYFRN